MDEIQQAGAQQAGQIRRLKKIGIITSLAICVFLPTVLFFGTRIVLDSFQWFYADLYHSCGGYICEAPTVVGWLVLVVYSLLCGILGSYISIALYKKVNQSSSGFGALVLILIFVFFFGFNGILQRFNGKIPRTPIAFRCASVIDKKGEYIDVYLGGRGGCLNELAVINRDVTWCKGMDFIYTEDCVANFAHETGDTSVCEALTSDRTKSQCLQAPGSE